MLSATQSPRSGVLESDSSLSSSDFTDDPAAAPSVVSDSSGSHSARSPDGAPSSTVGEVTIQQGDEQSECDRKTGPDSDSEEEADGVDPSESKPNSCCSSACDITPSTTSQFVGNFCILQSHPRSCLRLLNAVFVLLCIGLGFLGEGNFLGLPNRINSEGWKEFCRVWTHRLGVSCNGPYFAYRLSFSATLLFVVTLFFLIPYSRCCCCMFCKKCCCFGDAFRIRIEKSPWVWLAKVSFFVFATVISFLIPDAFFMFYGLFCILVGAFFLCLQMMMCIDCGFGWRESWKRRGSDVDGDLPFPSSSWKGKIVQSVDVRKFSGWEWALFGVSVIEVVVGLVFFVVNIVSYGIGSSLTCRLNLGLALGLSLASFPCVFLSFICGHGWIPGASAFCLVQLSVLGVVDSNPAECLGSSRSPAQFSLQRGLNQVAIFWSFFLNAVIVLLSAYGSSLTFLRIGRFCAADAEDNDNGQPPPSVFSMPPPEEDPVKEQQRQVNLIVQNFAVYIMSTLYFGAYANSWDVGDWDPNHPWNMGASYSAMGLQTISVVVAMVYFVWSLFGVALCGKLKAGCRKIREHKGRTEASSGEVSHLIVEVD